MMSTKISHMTSLFILIIIMHMAEYLKEDFMEKQPQKEGEIFPEIAKKSRKSLAFSRFQDFRRKLEFKEKLQKAASRPKRAEPLKE